MAGSGTPPGDFHRRATCGGTSSFEVLAPGGYLLLWEHEVCRMVTTIALLFSWEGFLFWELEIGGVCVGKR